MFFETRYVEYCLFQRTVTLLCFFTSQVTSTRTHVVKKQRQLNLPSINCFFQWREGCRDLPRVYHHLPHSNNARYTFHSKMAVPHVEMQPHLVPQSLTERLVRSCIQLCVFLNSRPYFEFFLSIKVPLMPGFTNVD